MSFNKNNLIRIDSNLGGEHGVFAYYTDSDEYILTAGYFPSQIGIQPGDQIIHTVLTLDALDGHCTGKRETIYYAQTSSNGTITVASVDNPVIDRLDNRTSVLKTTTSLSTSQDDQTEVELDDLEAMDIDGRPSYKQPGALVVDADGTIGIIDSLDENEQEEEIAVVTTVFTLCGDTGLKSITGYDSTKTQKLQNISGTLTWTDEA